MFWKTKKDKRIERLESASIHAEREMSSIRDTIRDFLYHSSEYREIFGQIGISYGYPETRLSCLTDQIKNQQDIKTREAEIRRVVTCMQQEEEKKCD